MTETVVDASVLLKLVLEEDDSPAWRTWYQNAILTGDRLVAPANLYAETGRVVQRRFAELTEDERRIVHGDLTADIALLDPSLDDDWDAARDLEFFDALYLGAAQGRTLVTADARMAREARARGIRVVEPQASS